MTAPRHLTLRERIYEEIVSLIVSGELPSGSAIDERELTQRLEVSRTPFREAIGTLAKEGLVEIRPYRGFYVRSFTLKEITDLFELRKVLECFSTKLAVAHMSDAALRTFERLLDEGVAALRRADMETYAARDREFHRSIAQLSANAALIETLDRLDLQIQICRVIANESRDLARRAAEERDQILDAFRSRDAARAAQLMHDHIADVQHSMAARYAQRAGAAGAR